MMEKSTGPNYLGILTIAWCYILSARLVEMQGEGASMSYTSSQAYCLGEGLYNLPETHIVDIGDADGDVVRWWSAVLAQHEGWKAIVKQTTSGEFLAPWAVSRTCETPFAIKHRGSPTFVQTPLSSDRAFDALSKFARLYELGSQFPIALATAMSFPIHRYYGSNVQLPFPRAHGGKTPTTPLGIPVMWTDLNEDLPYYMTLRCSPEVMMSTLCGSFLEPDVPCNLVSQWLHPVLEEVLGDLSAIKGSGQELFALIGVTRRPSVSVF